MILVDTSIWIDHLRNGDDRLKSLLIDGQVFIHPFIIGGLALGNLRQRRKILQLLMDLPEAITANDNEAIDFIEKHSLYGLGIGYIDAHLLASAKLSSVLLWTKDKKLHEVAKKLKLASFP